MRRLIYHSIFQAGYWISLLGTYEKFWETFRLGIDASVWFGSTTIMGLSIPHHVYIGFILLAIGYLALTIMDFRNTVMSYPEMSLQDKIEFYFMS